MGRLFALIAAVAILAGAGTAVAAVAHKGARYAGSTAQHQRISFRVSRDGRSVKRFSTTVLYTCTGGVHASGVFRSRPMAIRKGKFGESAPAYGLSSGQKVKSARSTITGRFLRGGVAVGTIRERATLTNGWVCRSGIVAFTVNVTR
jgi:hypothetical protein